MFCIGFYRLLFYGLISFCRRKKTIY